MTPALEQLRTEHATQFIGPELSRLLAGVASATARTYPPSYSPAGVWNAESIADALQSWTTERLIARRDLAQLLAGANSVSSLRAGLTRSFGQFLTNCRERTSATNLFQRIVKMLRAEPERFRAVGSAPKPQEQLWTLAVGSTDEPTTMPFAARLRVAAELSDDELGVVRYKALSLKSSPILREDGLRRLLIHLLGGVGPITPADIMDIMRRRFALVDPEPVELAEDLLVAAPPVPTRAADGIVVRSIVARLGQPRVETLRALVEYEDIKLAAKALSVAPSVVQQAYTDLERMVIAEAAEPDEVRHLCGLALESLFGENE